MESEELNNSRIKTSQNARTIKLTDFLYIDKEEVNKTRNDIINRYYWIIQNRK